MVFSCEVFHLKYLSLSNTACKRLQDHVNISNGFERPCCCFSLSEIRLTNILPVLPIIKRLMHIDNQHMCYICLLGNTVILSEASEPAHLILCRIFRNCNNSKNAYFSRDWPSGTLWKLPFFFKFGLERSFDEFSPCQYQFLRYLPSLKMTIILMAFMLLSRKDKCIRLSGLTTETSSSNIFGGV